MHWVSWSAWRLHGCRFVAVVVGLGLLLALTNAGPAAADEARFGFNDWQVRSQLPLQAAVGAPIRRWSVAWNEVETSPGVWDWSRYDAQYQMLTAAGLQPLVIARGAPCWAHPSTPCEGAGSATPADPAYDGAWAEFAQRLAARYPGVAAVEIWNEPNTKPSFLPYPDATRFTELLKAAYAAVKGVDPALPVISGGLFVSRGTGPFGVGNAQFLASMYAAGAQGYMDGIGIHPYPRMDPLDAKPRLYDPRLFDQILAGVRATRDAAGDSATPLWVTEVGESTATMPGFPEAVSEHEQAADLVTIVRAVRAAPDIPVAVIHRLADLPLDQGGTYGAVEAGFGVFRTDGSPKPAACALSRELGGFLATTEACVDDPPTAVDDTAAVTEDDPAAVLDVLANDDDPDGDPIAIESFSQPENGSVAAADGSPGLTYEPDPDFCNDPGSPDAFSYTINGGASAQVTVAVACVDDPADTTRPQVYAPVVELQSDVTLTGGGSDVRARISWPEAVDDSTAPEQLEYNLQQQVDGGAWRGATGWISGHAAARVLTGGVSYRFRVLARDAAGNVGRAEGPDAVVASVRPADDPAISYSKGWVTNRPTPLVYGGYVRPTSRVGSSATFRFTARALGVVMRRGTGYGTGQACLTDVTVSAPAACTEIDLGYDGAGARRVVYAPSGLDPSHSYELVVTNLGGRIELDAIALLG